MKGYVQVYTGNGKGKTTAAIGLAVRAAGAGLRVFIGQFMKSGGYSEIRGLERFADSVTVESYGSEHFITGEPSRRDKERAREGFTRIREAVRGGSYQVVILDEINVAVRYRLIREAEVLELIASRPSHVELVLTGRDAPPSVVARADLVTEMRDIKHYHAAGVPARRGIEL